MNDFENIWSSNNLEPLGSLHHIRHDFISRYWPLFFKTLRMILPDIMFENKTVILTEKLEM